MKAIETLKVDDVYMILEAAKLWFQRQYNIGNNFALELKRTRELQSEFYKVDWDDDAEFALIEKPF